VPPDSADAWLAALDQRHLADLTPSEVTRALRALSSCYVHRRERIAAGAALDGAGKRAAFALFYGPQHFFAARAIARELSLAGSVRRVIDLGCGTGAAGAAIALEARGAAIEGFDLNPWAVREANWTYRTLHLAGRARVAGIPKVRLAPAPGVLVLAAWTVNELSGVHQDDLLARVRDACARGASVLVVEPIGRRANPWWPSWAAVVSELGGREDDWRFAIRLPPRQRALAKAAGLAVDELTARSLFLPPSR